MNKDIAKKETVSRCREKNILRILTRLPLKYSISETQPNYTFYKKEKITEKILSRIKHVCKKKFKKKY